MHEECPRAAAGCQWSSSGRPMMAQGQWHCTHPTSPHLTSLHRPCCPVVRNSPSIIAPNSSSSSLFTAPSIMVNPVVLAAANRRAGMAPRPSAPQATSHRSTTNLRQSHHGNRVNSRYIHKNLPAASSAPRVRNRLMPPIPNSAIPTGIRRRRHQTAPTLRKKIQFDETVGTVTFEDQTNGGAHAPLVPVSPTPLAPGHFINASR